MAAASSDDSTAVSVSEDMETDQDTGITNGSVSEIKPGIPSTSHMEDSSSAAHYTTLQNYRSPGDVLTDLAQKLDDYQPTIPDAVVNYYMQSAGVQSSDVRITRLISIAAQKFVSDIANDALQHCKMRGAGQSSKKASKDKRYVLSMEDLTPALAEYGINVKKPHYTA